MNETSGIQGVNKADPEEFRYAYNAIADFEEASAFVATAYKVLRRLAGTAIKRNAQYETKLSIVGQLAADLDIALMDTDPDLDYMRRVSRAIKDVASLDNFSPIG